MLHESCTTALDRSDLAPRIDLSFLDPPFNQDKVYNAWDDNLPPEEYWQWMHGICAKVYALTSDGGALYFMQREKNTEFVLQCLRDTGWTFQNLIIWKKKTSAVPGEKILLNLVDYRDIHNDGEFTGFNRGFAARAIVSECCFLSKGDRRTCSVRGLGDGDGFSERNTARVC